LSAAKLYRLSFCDPKLPEGSQFVGASVVRASHMTEAIKLAHAYNPTSKAPWCLHIVDPTSAKRTLCDVAIDATWIVRPRLDQPICGLCRTLRWGALKQAARRAQADER
jgi:hypothetical protein